MNRTELVQKLIPTLYEDEHIVAVGKPAGIDAGGGEKLSPASVVEILRRARGDRKPLETINRLSRYESGALLLGKDSETIRHIRSVMRAGRVKQYYLAVAAGRMARPQLTIDPAYGTSRGKQDRMGSGRTTPQSTRKRRGEQKTRLPDPRAGGHGTVVRLVRAGEKRLLIRCNTTAATTHTLRAQLRAQVFKAIENYADSNTKQSAGF